MTRPDRVGDHRTAFEKNRQIILHTQKICALCGQEVDFGFKYPHPLSPAIDHIIPVSKGGHPSDLANLQLTHRCCNRAKSDKLFIENAKKENAEEKNDKIELPLHYDWINYHV